MYSSMLGSKGNAGVGRTGVAIQGLQTRRPEQKKAKKKKGASGGGKVDEVVREDLENELIAALSREDRGSNKQELAQPPGHGAGTKTVAGEAFRTDQKGREVPPTFSDVDQGNLGDSWLLAACAAVAHSAPQHLLRRVKRNKRGTFDVKLASTKHTVNPDFSTEGYANPTPNGMQDTLWVALVEKAFAQRLAGSYLNLETGTAGRALEALTGRPSVRTTITETVRPDKIFAKLRAGKESERAMVISTRESGVSSPLHPDHAYAVLDAFEKDGAKLVRLFNPWGTNGGTRRLDEVTYDIRIEDLGSNAEALHVSGA